MKLQVDGVVDTADMDRQVEVDACQRGLLQIEQGEGIDKVHF